MRHYVDFVLSVSAIHRKFASKPDALLGYIISMGSHFSVIFIEAIRMEPSLVI